MRAINLSFPLHQGIPSNKISLKIVIFVANVGIKSDINNNSSSSSTYVTSLNRQVVSCIRNLCGLGHKIFFRHRTGFVVPVLFFFSNARILSAR